jgi:tripeptidyl-peptidase-1
MPSFFRALLTFLALYWVSRVYGAQLPNGISANIFEKLGSVPRGWRESGDVAASKRLHFRIAVKLENAFAFEQHVIDISTPGHEKYGEHMSRQELKRALRPSPDATDSIVGWLRREGITEVKDDGDWINFDATASEAGRILDTTYVLFRLDANPRRGQRCLRSLPVSQERKTIKVPFTSPFLLKHHVLGELLHCRHTIDIFVS